MRKRLDFRCEQSAHGGQSEAFMGIASSRTGRTPGYVDGVQDLVGNVSGLAALDEANLRRRWAELFGEPPPAGLARSLLIQALAYRLQERALGGLKPSTRRLLERIAKSPAAFAVERRPKASAGTVLIREWRGVTHRVTVLEHDVVYRGRRYQSLSEIARMITGTRWSGPLFFGLKRRTGKAANG
jgi:hypothetical protein